MSDTRWIKQLVLIEDEGETLPPDSMQAVIASLLGLEYEDVPHFLDEASDMDDFWNRIIDFLDGMNRDLISCDKDTTKGYWIAFGLSPRGESHVVVMNGPDIMHDPHPANSGLVKIEFGYRIVVRDPKVTTDEMMNMVLSEEVPGEPEPQDGSFSY